MCLMMTHTVSRQAKYDRTSCFGVFKAQAEGQTCDLWDVWSGQSLCVVSAAAQHLCYLSLHKQQLSLHLLQLLLDPESESFIWVRFSEVVETRWIRDL